MENKTDGDTDRAAQLEEWPISSFAEFRYVSFDESVTMISARDASASEKNTHSVNNIGLRDASTSKI